ncbi:hypothetical protein BC834DRAFT_967528 [Gloeopeniophorella convolvens]|nr:hypothetical protein BC834DRAFT_967528 [Gloeopeniophorella convolvens]
MGEFQPSFQSIVFALHALLGGRYSITAVYTVLFYDWLISLDKEVTFIHPAPWNAVKGAYLFCRYYPLLMSPFHLYGFLGDHTERVCNSYYHALYATLLPTMMSAQFILMLRAYAFSGRRRSILVVLSSVFTGVVGIVIWMLCKHLELTSLFIIERRSGCFVTSDQPHDGTVRGIGAYHLGIISVASALFDFLNMSVVVRHCIKQRSTLGPLGQSFLKQGVIVYLVMTCINTITIGTYFTSHTAYQGIGSWFAYILPSTLSCRLVLMLRRKASPTDTELHDQLSHMVDEALEMILVEEPPTGAPRGPARSSSRASRVQS